MITRARSRRQPAALPALPREVVQHIFSVKPPGRGRYRAPVLSFVDRVRHRFCFFREQSPWLNLVHHPGGQATHPCQLFTITPASLQVRAQAVCTSWRSYLDPRQWPFEYIYLGDNAPSLQVASWVSTLQPAVRALHIRRSCDDLLFSALSLAPRTVSGAGSTGWV